MFTDAYMCHHAILDWRGVLNFFAEAIGRNIWLNDNGSDNTVGYLAMHVASL